MAKELEVKVLNIDKKELEEKLLKLGATLIKKEHQINTVLDTKEGNIENSGKGYLRIRESKDLANNKVEYILTFKKNINNNGIRENKEIETKFTDKKAMIEILENLDVYIKNEGSKERISYEYEAIRFDIDTWDKDTYPYPYLEIEVTKKEDIDKAIRLLNVDEKDITLKSLKQLRQEAGLE
ncbi:adenylate cyclase [Gottschalkia acidurici 9a]|uniref:Adenylate cyclase n=1 Tax=Gottschalkia acidurici (strain ATCC 7906 / DSM 604 / BCRC 14475 / CIP 104303 / KCTC 5404 / NCIMB 10678 / 9a) TaxID=1128398 RepID=K0AWZ0_GOTA9|nr:class IV adenylate cyclase [Gottschalkia acidurici]AFS77754.1 adenylate cyclase [Gottschalkia acidurici 9a]